MAESENSIEVPEAVIEEGDEGIVENTDEDHRLEKHGTKRRAEERKAMKQKDHGKERKKQKGNQDQQMRRTTLTNQTKTFPGCTFSPISSFLPQSTTSTPVGVASVGLIHILSRLEQKIDWLTFIMTGTSTPGHDHLHQQVSLQTDLEQSCSTSSETSMDTKDTHEAHLQSESSPPINLAAKEKDEDDQTASTNLSVNVPERIVELHIRSKTSTNFAVRLVREMFERSELFGRNVCGVRGKLQMDPVRINRIKDLVNQFYPSSLAERELVWRNCRKAIDSFLRKVK